MKQSRTRVALLIDGDNSASISMGALLVEAEKLGEVIIRRVYGNWSSPSMHGWQDIARLHGLEQRHHGQTVPGKNATDIALAIDAMDILYSGAVDHFCLVASDSDYTPLVVRLRSAGYRVLGIGKPTTPQALKAACTMFVATDDLLPIPAPIPARLASAPSSAALSAAEINPLATEPLSLLMNAYEEVAQREGGEWVRLSDMGIALRQADAGFRPSLFGRKDLQTLVNAYPDQFETRRQLSKGKPVLVRRKQAPAQRVFSPPSAGVTAQKTSGKRGREKLPHPQGAPAPQKIQPSGEEALAALLIQAHRRAAGKLHEEWVSIPHLNVALKQLDPQFKAGVYGYKNLPTAVQRYPELFQTRRQTAGKTKHVEVRLLPGK